MQIPALPFTVTHWSGIPPTVHLGETGQATWRTFTIGDLRVSARRRPFPTLNGGKGAG